MVKSATILEKKRMAKLTFTPCIVCLIYYNLETPAEVHHLLENGRRRGHIFSISLCFRHHREGVNNRYYVSRHPHEAEFIRRYGSEDYLLDETNKIINDY